LLAQDYPTYAVWIVIDSADNPARAVVRKILDKPSKSPAPVHVLVLERRLEACSLKLSAQRQALRVITGAGQAYSVVAFIDADVVPARDWLRSLVLPLLDPQVGVSTGVR
jgi:cellulose synthase/poly-beta-1,6-N-acetylglucosamine synthase-like glycosyltransferase